MRKKRPQVGGNKVEVMQEPEPLSPVEEAVPSIKEIVDELVRMRARTGIGRGSQGLNRIKANAERIRALKVVVNEQAHRKDSIEESIFSVLWCLVQENKPGPGATARLIPEHRLILQRTLNLEGRAGDLNDRVHFLLQELYDDEEEWGAYPADQDAAYTQLARLLRRLEVTPCSASVPQLDISRGDDRQVEYLLVALALSLSEESRSRALELIAPYLRGGVRVLDDSGPARSDAHPAYSETAAIVDQLIQSAIESDTWLTKVEQYQSLVEPVRLLGRYELATVLRSSAGYILWAENSRFIVDDALSPRNEQRGMAQLHVSAHYLALVLQHIEKAELWPEILFTLEGAEVH